MDAMLNYFTENTKISKVIKLFDYGKNENLLKMVIYDVSIDKQGKKTKIPTHVLFLFLSVLFIF